MRYINETNKIEVMGDYDVIVVGGGVAGVSAALAARRNGAKTLLVEKSTMLGGLATLGLIVLYLPLCDGRGKKVIGGIAEELLHLSIKYGFDDLAKEWRDGPLYCDTTKRYRTTFSMPEFVIAMDEIMENEGVDVLFDTVMSKPIMEDEKCKGIIIENKSGRSAYAAKAFVDASGDADLMARAGAECIKRGSWLNTWVFFASLDNMKKSVDTGDVKFGVNWRGYGRTPKGERNYSVNEEGIEVTDRLYHGTDAKDVTDFIIDSRKLVRKSLSKWDKKEKRLTTLSGMAQMRTTRRIKGLYEMREDEVFKRFEDSIGCTGDWRNAGPIFEIPYRTLISEDVSNILAAGRIISTQDDAWEITRVIPTAAMTGQAAGTAAAMSALEYESVHKIDIAQLQDNLKKSGVIIHNN